MKSSVAMFAAALAFGLVAACSAGSGGTKVTPVDAGPDSDPPVCGGDCVRGTHLDPKTCACVPDNPACADPGICGPGLAWDFVACACEPTTVCAGTPCPIGTEWDPKLCQCITLDGGPRACFIPGYGECGYGQTCVVGYCSDSSPITCYCDPYGNVSCGGACPPQVDGGPPPPPPPPPYDGGPPDSGPIGCWLPGYGYCPPYTSCITGYCPDNVTPVSCFCEGNGVSQCTGACPPGPPHTDGGVTDASWRD